MRPARLEQVISQANEALFNVGSSAVVGDSWHKDTVKYFYQDDVLVEYVPLDDRKASDDGN